MRDLEVCILIGSPLHLLRVQVCVLIGYADVRVLLLLTQGEEVRLGVETLVRDRLGVFSLLVRALVTRRFQLLKLGFVGGLVGKHLSSEVQILVVLDLLLVLV